MIVMLFSVLLYKLQSIIMYQCLPLPFLVLFSCTFPFLPVWPFYPQWRYPEGYCTPFQPVFSKCCYNEKCIDIFIISSMFTSSVWGGFSNSWCFSSTLKGVPFFGSSMGFLCTGLLGFNFKPAKGGGGSSSFPLEACVSACCVCNFWGIKISYEYF